MIKLEEKLQKIDRLTNEGYELQIGKYISEAFDIFKKNTGGFILFTVLTFVVSFALGTIPHKIGSIISFVISAPLNMGFVIVARKIRYNENYSFNDFFKGFDRFLDLFLAYLVVIIFVIIGMILLVLPGIYLAVAYAFVNCLVWFLYDGSITNTLERSRKLVSKRWWSFLGFFLVIFLLNVGGILCLGIGLLVTAPVSAISIYVCFEDLIGTEEEVAVSEVPVSGSAQ